MSSRNVRFEVEKTLKRNRKNQSKRMWSSGYVKCMIYYKKTKLLIAGVYDGRTGLRGFDELRTEMYVFNVETGKCVKKIEYRSRANTLEILDDDFFIAGFSNGEIAIFKTEDFEFSVRVNTSDLDRIPIRSMLKLTDSVVVIGDYSSELKILNLAYSQDNQSIEVIKTVGNKYEYEWCNCLKKCSLSNDYFVSGGGKQGGKGWMLLWTYSSPSTFKVLRRFRERKEVRSFTTFVDSNGREILVSCGVSKNLIFWDLQNGNELKSMKFGNSYLYYLKNYLNKFLFCSGDSGKMFVVNLRNLKSQVHGENDKIHDRMVSSICVVDEGENVLVSGDAEGVIKRIKFFYDEDEDEVERVSYVQKVGDLKSDLFCVLFSQTSQSFKISKVFLLF